MSPRRLSERSAGGESNAAGPGLPMSKRPLSELELYDAYIAYVTAVGVTAAFDIGPYASISRSQAVNAGGLVGNAKLLLCLEGLLGGHLVPYRSSKGFLVVISVPY